MFPTIVRSAAKRDAGGLPRVAGKLADASEAMLAGGGPPSPLAGRLTGGVSFVRGFILRKHLAQP